MRDSISLRNSTWEISARLPPPETAVILMVTFLTAIWPPKSTAMEPSGCTVAAPRKRAISEPPTVMGMVFVSPSSSYSTSTVAPLTAFSAAGGVWSTIPAMGTAALAAFSKSKLTVTGFSSEIAAPSAGFSATALSPVSRSSRLPLTTWVDSSFSRAIRLSGTRTSTEAVPSPVSSREAASICRSTRSAAPLRSRSATPACPPSMASIRTLASPSVSWPSPSTSPMRRAPGWRLSAV